MRFAQAEHFAGFLMVAVVVVILSWFTERRRRAMARFTQEHLLKDIAFQYDPDKARRKNLLLVFALSLSVLALARPQWGFQWREVKREGVDILVVIDTSKSMLTQDVKPNRLQRTKFAVQDLVRKLRGDRIGLIAFSGSPFLICPLTTDYGGYLISLNDINIDTVPRGGTNLELAIEEAIKDYDKTASQYKAIVIITDGDNLEGDPIAAAKKAKDKGIKIYTVGIGSAQGELIQLRSPQGETVFLKDNNGNFVKSRLNERLLKEIALITGGVYVKASGGQFGLDLIYDRELSKLEKREIEAQMEKKYYERFQIPLAFAVLFLVLETCLTTRKK